jgi:hypothetical protein
LSAALKMSLKPFASESASFIDCVLAARQPDSDPVWANPTVITLPPEVVPGVPLAVAPEPELEPEPAFEPEPEHPVTANVRAPTSASPASKLFLFLILKTSSF